MSRPVKYVQSRITKSNDTEIKRNELLDYILSTDLVDITGTGVAIQTADYPKSGDGQVASWVGLLQHGLEYCRTHALIEDDDTEIIELQLKKPTTASLIDAARQIYEWLDRKKGNARYSWLQESVGQLKVHNPALIRALAGLGGLLSTLNCDSLHTDVTGRTPLHWQQLVDVDEHVRRKSKRIHISHARLVEASRIDRFGPQILLRDRKQSRHARAHARLRSIPVTAFRWMRWNFFRSQFSNAIELGERRVAASTTSPFRSVPRRGGRKAS